MRAPNRRTFSLMDAMALVGATAVGLAGLRFALGDLREVREELRESLTAVVAPPDPLSPWLWTIVAGYGFVATVLVPFCWAWTLAILALRFRQPRPRLRQLARQPGAIACYSAGLVLFPALLALGCLGVISSLLFNVKYESLAWQQGLGFSFMLLPALTGFAVLGSWATLLAGRRWRPEPTWIDRAGRVLGTYWISTILLPAWGLS